MHTFRSVTALAWLDTDLVFKDPLGIADWRTDSVLHWREMLPNSLPRSSVLQRADSVHRKFIQCRRYIAAAVKITPSQVD